MTSSASSSPNKTNSLQDLTEVRSNISSLVLNKLRSCSCFPEEPLNEEDLLILETFFDSYLTQIFMASCRPVSQEENNWRWITSLLKELEETLSESMFLMNKTKHLILIPLMKSFHALMNSPSTPFILDDTDVGSCIWAMKSLLTLLLSFSVSSHEIQFFLSLIGQHRSLHFLRRNAFKTVSPSSITPPSQVLQETVEASPTDASQDKTEEEDYYFSLLTGALSQPVLSKIPANFFAFTSYSCLSLPPVKTFPIKGFSFSTHIRLEALSLVSTPCQPHSTHQSKTVASASKNDQRMFLFSFKSS